ncbi:MAG: hypothetical protein ACRD1N_02685, partial [Terriglobia bacterium]
RNDIGALALQTPRVGSARRLPRTLFSNPKQGEKLRLARRAQSPAPRPLAQSRILNGRMAA